MDQLEGVQDRGAKIIRFLESNTDEERLKEWGKTKGILINLQILEGQLEKMEMGFSVATADRTTNNSFKLQQRKFRLKIGRNSLWQEATIGTSYLEKLQNLYTKSGPWLTHPNQVSITFSWKFLSGARAGLDDLMRFSSSLTSSRKRKIRVELMEAVVNL